MRGMSGGQTLHESELSTVLALEIRLEYNIICSTRKMRIFFGNKDTPCCELYLSITARISAIEKVKNTGA